MNTVVTFPNWSNALENANLPVEEKARHRIIINWFLGHLKRERCPASVQSARSFIEGLVESRRPGEWQLEQWREGLNWFFREAPSRRRVVEQPRQSAEGGVREDREAERSGVGESSSVAASSKADEARDFEDGRRYTPIRLRRCRRVCRWIRGMTKRRD